MSGQGTRDACGPVTDAETTAGGLVRGRPRQTSAGSARRARLARAPSRGAPDRCDRQAGWIARAASPSIERSFGPGGGRRIAEPPMAALRRADEAARLDPSRLQLGELPADADAGVRREARAVVDDRPGDIAGLLGEFAEAPFAPRTREAGVWRWDAESLRLLRERHARGPQLAPGIGGA